MPRNPGLWDGIPLGFSDGAQARDAYARISAARVPLDAKSGADHLEALSEGIKLFRELAEL